jgi:hypothetical protein
MPAAIGDRRGGGARTSSPKVSRASVSARPCVSTTPTTTNRPAVGPSAAGARPPAWRRSCRPPAPRPGRSSAARAPRLPRLRAAGPPGAGRGASGMGGPQLVRSEGGIGNAASSARFSQQDVDPRRAVGAPARVRPSVCAVHERPDLRRDVRRRARRRSRAACARAPPPARRADRAPRPEAVSAGPPGHAPAAGRRVPIRGAAAGDTGRAAPATWARGWTRRRAMTRS